MFHLGDGQDVFDGSSNTDTVRFGPGIELSDIQVMQDPQSGSNLVITLAETLDRLTIRNVEYLTFDDGTSVTVSAIVQSTRLSASGGVQLSGSGGDDHLAGTSDSDVLIGGEGNDSLSGGGGSDTYQFAVGDGADVINDAGDSASVDVLIFGGGILPQDLVIQVSATDPNDAVIKVGSTGDSVTLVGQFLSDGSGIEQILFDDGTVWGRENITAVDIAGQVSDGDDQVIGTALAETIEAGTGNDLLQGGFGGDTYRYKLGDGIDTIEDSGGETTIDRLEFGPGIAVVDVVFSRGTQNSNDLLLFLSQTEQVLIKDQFTGSQNGVDEIVFDDGTVITRQSMIARVLSGSSTANDDVIIGFSTDDTIGGQAGNDELNGAGGADTYVFGAADGHDKISDTGLGSEIDTLSFDPTISAQDVLVERTQEGDYVLKDADDTWSVTLQSLPGRPAGGLEQIAFSDGTQWSVSELDQKYYDQAAVNSGGTIYGNNQDEVISGGASDEAIFGGGGNDSLNGGRGNDVLVGGDGNDILKGGADDDVLEGGLGTDSFDGGAGSDTIHFGYSNVGWLIDLAAGTAAAVTQPTVIETVANIENVVGSSHADTITGSLENNRLAGGLGGDTYVLNAGFGQDIVVDDGNASIDAVDTVSFGAGLSGAGLTLTKHGESTLKVLVNGTNDVLLIEDMFAEDKFAIEQFAFADGSFWSWSQISARLAADIAASGITHDGNGLSEQIIGSSGDDALCGRTGDDAVSGGLGSDTYVFNAGDGQDTIEDNGGGNADRLVIHGYSPSDLILSTKPNDTLVISFVGSSDRITLVNTLGSDSTDIIEQFVFDDGTIYTIADMAGLVASQAVTGMQIYGTAGADSLRGTDGNDTMHGYGDHDVIDGGLGADSLMGGEGNDRIIIDENDVWYAGDGGIDTVVYSGSADIQYALEQGAFEHAEMGSGNDTIWGGASDNIIHGGAGNDTLHGNGGHDVLEGGAGADSLMGGEGNDRVIVDEFDVWFAGDGGIDTVVYNGSADFQYALDNGGFEHAEMGSGNDQIWGGASDNHIHGGAGNDTIQGFGGHDVIEGGAGADSLMGGEGNDRIIVDEFDVWIAGDAGIDTVVYNGSADFQYYLDTGAFEHAEMGSGNDTIWGGASDNDIHGGAGNDTLLAYAGTDTLNGGLGDDTLTGGADNDSFIFDADFGNDVITDFTAGAASDDVIEFRGIASLDSYANVLANAADDGTDTTITLDAGNTVVLQNVLVSELHSDDFRFA